MVAAYFLLLLDCYFSGPRCYARVDCWRKAERATTIGGGQREKLHNRVGGSGVCAIHRAWRISSHNRQAEDRSL
jgi:hypothetical protein